MTKSRCRFATTIAQIRNTMRSPRSTNPLLLNTMNDTKQPRNTTAATRNQTNQTHSKNTSQPQQPQMYQKQCIRDWKDSSTYVKE